MMSKVQKLTELLMDGKNMQYLAIDLGSSSARIMLADGNKNLALTELARFPHSASLDSNGHYRWDIDKLFASIKEEICEAIKKYQISSIGICSWGVDYGVIGEDGKLIDMPYCYRDSRGELMFKELHKQISQEELFALSGIYPNSINTIYQLYADKMADRYVGNKVKIAMIADLLAFYLTGNIRIERSNASTTGILNLQGTDWNYQLLNRLGIDCEILPKLIFDGEQYGEFCGVPVVAVGTHDTASAIYALEGLDNKTAFLASGSWLLFGKVLDSPVCEKIAFENRYTNERINGGKVSLLDNINGLFIIQRLVSENNLNYKQIDENIDSAKVLGELDVDKLMSQDDMTGDMKKQLGIADCNIHDLVKTAYYSLAKRVVLAVERLEQVTGEKIEKIVMTGGATKAKYFVGMLKNLSKIDIICTKSEGATFGNALRQSRV